MENAKKVIVKNFDKREYEKWLSTNEKEDCKKARIEYLATVLGQGKECWEKLKNGEITEDNVEVLDIDNSFDDVEKIISKIEDREIEGFKLVLKGLQKIIGSTKDLPLTETTEDGTIKLIFAKVMSTHCVGLMEAYEEAVKGFEIYSIAKELFEMVHSKKSEEGVA